MHQQWLPYQEVYPGDGHTVSGDVRVLRGIAGHGVTPRDLLVYLPPGYATHPAARYPVLYLHDGQNVFDDATSFAGEWGADEAAEALAARGLEAILVAVPNGRSARSAEYSPWPIRPRSRAAGARPLAPGAATRADAYLAFLAETVKPCVDASFRTRPAHAHTGIAGSSLGALAALYASFARPETFGFCAALSPALWPGRGGIFSYVQARHNPGLRVYLDAGRREAGDRFVAQVRRLRDLLQERGYDVAYVEDEAGQHSEEDWRRRFPAALAWFLDPQLAPDR